jgi:transposase InsO family protein
MGPAKWTYFYLYVILDIFSRYVVGWMVAHRESAALAERLIAETCEKQGIKPGQLTLHADRGTSMTSKPVAFLLADLGVLKTHSRPHVSNDNPFSESQFKTMKYRPEFPDRFGSLQDARAFGHVFFPWYNDQHSTTTVPWDSSRPPSSTMAWPTASDSSGSRSSQPRTQLTPRGSSGGRPSLPPCLRLSGSTHPRKRLSRMLQQSTRVTLDDLTIDPFHPRTTAQ